MGLQKARAPPTTRGDAAEAPRLPSERPPPLWEKPPLYRPMNLAAMVFMISLVPAKMLITRTSRQARAMGYSSQ